MKEKILKTARERRHIMQEKKKSKKNKVVHFFSETLPSEETAKLSLMYET